MFSLEDRDQSIQMSVYDALITGIGHKSSKIDGLREAAAHDMVTLGLLMFEIRWIADDKS